MAKDYAKATFKATRARYPHRSRRRLFSLIFVLICLGVGIVAGYFYQHRIAIVNAVTAEMRMSQLKAWLHRPALQAVTHPNIKTEPVNSAAQEPEIRFDFYTELPNMQMTLPVTQNEETKGTPLPVSRVNPLASETSQQKDSKSQASELKNSGDSQLKKSELADNSAAITRELTAQTNATKKATLSTHSSTTVDNPSSGPQYVVQLGVYKSDSVASEMRVSILLAGFDAKVVKSTLADQTVYRIQQGPYHSLAGAKAGLKKLQAKGFDGIVQKIG